MGVKKGIIIMFKKKKKKCYHGAGRAGGSMGQGCRGSQGKAGQAVGQTGPQSWTSGTSVGMRVD